MPSLRVFTFGHALLASTRVRFKEFEPDLASRFALTVSEGRPHLWSALSDARFDAIYLQKVLPPLSWWRAIRSVPRTPHIVYDFDDAIWERPGQPRSWWSRTRLNMRLRAAFKNADVVTTCSEYLARFARPCAKSVAVIPITVPPPPSQRTTPMRQDGTAVIGWCGHPSGHALLESIDASLVAFKARYERSSILVLSGRRPNLTVPFEWLEWSLEREVEYFGRVSIGVAPLANSPLDLGKSPLKIVQHLSCGIPVVTNGLGGTEEIARGGGVVQVDGSSKSWVAALAGLAENPAAYDRTAADASANYRRSFNSEAVRGEFLKAFELPLRSVRQFKGEAWRD